MKSILLILVIAVWQALSLAPCFAGIPSPAETRAKADQGDAEAQFNLGCMYYVGDSVPRDFAEAMKWWRKAADQGNAAAQFDLGFMYDTGDGVPRDYVEAIKWYRRAVDQGELSLNLGDGRGQAAVA